MTTPIGPKGFALSRDWWLSGSAWHRKTPEDVWTVLGVETESPERRASAVRSYYLDHQDRLKYVPVPLRGADR